MKRRLSIILFLILINTGLSNASSWKTEILNGDGTSSGYNSICIDQSNKIHVSHRIDSSLHYITNVPDSWSTVLIDDVGSPGMYNDIAIDSSGKLHISYLKWDSSDLMYATNSSGPWTTTQAGDDCSVSTSIAIDSSDKVHMCYHAKTVSDLFYTTNVSGSWVTVTLDTESLAGLHNDIAVDSADKIHIVYNDGGTHLRYITNKTGSWVKETLVNNNIFCSYPSIAIDSSDKVHISYKDNNDSGLKYTTNASGSWVTELIDTVGSVSESIPIAIDSSDKAHISYRHQSSLSLKYATNSSGPWVSEVVDSNGDTGFYPSIALDSLDNPHIVYQNDQRILKHATVSPTVTISGIPTNPTNSTSATLSASGINITTYKYKLDNEGYSAEIAIGTPITLSGLSEGTHTVSAIGKNSIGYWQAEADATTVSWTVDLTAPIATISGTPSNPTNSTSAILTVGGTGVVAYKYKLDDGSYSAEIAVATQISLNSLGEGLRTVSVIGKDSAGNWQSEASATTVSWTVDLTAPSGPIAINNGATACISREVAITLNSGDASQMSFSNDNSTFTDWEAYNSSKSWTLTDGDGAKTVYVKYRDSAGNISQVTSGNIVLDTVVPGSPTIINIDNTTENEPVFDWENVDGASYYIIEYANNSNFTDSTVVSNLTASDFTATSALNDGSWYWHIKAVDASGNISEWSSTGSISVDTSAYCGSDPLQPILLSPANNAGNESRTPTLTASTFEDSENCSTHFKTRWQISEHNDFRALTLNANTFDNLTTFEVMKSMLKPNTTFYWRVKYWGSYGNKSEWSDVFAFTTEAAIEDADGNGIPDRHAVSDTIDLDGDNIPDNNQTDVIKSIKAQKGNNHFGICPQDSQIVDIKILDADTIQDDSNKPSQVPYGLVSFRLEVPHYGDATTVKIHLSKKAPKNASWVKYDPVNGWLDYSGYAVFNTDRDEVTLELKDGGYGDDDHTENGIIVDPGGVGVLSNLGDIGNPSGSSSGCFIATAAYGSKFEPHVSLLREFRDKVLLKYSPGQLFIRLYYKYSPPLADRIKENNALRFVTRVLLLPLVAVSWIIMNFSQEAILIITVLILLFALISRHRRQQLRF